MKATSQIIPNTIVFRLWNSETVQNHVALESFKSKSSEKNIPNLCKFRFSTLETNNTLKNESISLSELNQIVLNTIGIDISKFTNIKSFENQKLYLKITNKNKSTIEDLIRYIEESFHTHNRFCVMVGFLNGCRTQIKYSGEPSKSVLIYNNLSYKASKFNDITMHNDMDRSFLLFEKNTNNWVLKNHSTTTQIVTSNSNLYKVYSLYCSFAMNDIVVETYTNKEFSKELRYQKLKLIFDDK